MSAWLRRRVAADRVVAALLLLPVAPVLAVVAGVVRAEARPAVLGVRRCGRGGRTFAMHKVRTMRPAGPDGLAGGAALSSGDDDRITPVGRRLRRLRIDELPQLADVVRGEMALIGPRPEDPRYVDLDDPRWTAVLQAPPGIVGPTQVLVHRWEAAALRGGDTEATYARDILPAKLAIDAWYVAAASPRIDLVTVVSLVQSLLGRDETWLHRTVAPGLLAPLPAAA
jgi:lipopolysaccharide/colanic/teichoic acid biosynthesis glycosyltransferase